MGSLLHTCTWHLNTCTRRHGHTHTHRHRHWHRQRHRRRCRRTHTGYHTLSHTYICTVLVIYLNIHTYIYRRVSILLYICDSTCTLVIAVTIYSCDHFLYLLERLHTTLQSNAWALIQSCCVPRCPSLWSMSGENENDVLYLAYDAKMLVNETWQLCLLALPLHVDTVQESRNPGSWLWCCDAETLLDLADL